MSMSPHMHDITGYGSEGTCTQTMVYTTKNRLPHKVIITSRKNVEHIPVSILFITMPHLPADSIDVLCQHKHFLRLT